MATFFYFIAIWIHYGNKINRNKLSGKGLLAFLFVLNYFLQKPLVRFLHAQRRGCFAWWRVMNTMNSVRCHGRFHLSYMDDKTDKTDVGQQMAASPDSLLPPKSTDARTFIRFIERLFTRIEIISIYITHTYREEIVSIVALFSADSIMINATAQREQANNVRAKFAHIKLLNIFRAFRTTKQNRVIHDFRTAFLPFLICVHHEKKI